MARIILYSEVHISSIKKNEAIVQRLGSILSPRKILTASSDIAYRIESNGVTDLIPTKMDSLF